MNQTKGRETKWKRRETGQKGSLQMEAEKTDGEGGARPGERGGESWKRSTPHLFCLINCCRIIILSELMFLSQFQWDELCIPGESSTSQFLHMLL